MVLWRQCSVQSELLRSCLNCVDGVNFTLRSRQHCPNKVSVFPSNAITMVGNTLSADEALEYLKWDTGSKHCLYLPGICIHAVPAFPGSNEDLHYQPRSFAPGTTVRPINMPQTQETHPALRPSRPSAQDDLVELSLCPSFASAWQLPLSLPPCAGSGPQTLFISSPPSSKFGHLSAGQHVSMLISGGKAFENTSTSVAASQMRNALNNLADTVTDPTEKKVCCNRLWKLRQ